MHIASENLKDIDSSLQSMYHKHSAVWNTLLYVMGDFHENKLNCCFLCWPISYHKIKKKSLATQLQVKSKENTIPQSRYAAIF